MTHREIVAQLGGIFPPVASPFNRRGEIDEKAFRANLQRYARTGLNGVLVAGSTGEAAYLTEAERLRLVEIARELIRPPKLLMAGTGLESTAATLRLSREAVARGADAVLLVPPNYYKPAMRPGVLENHFRTIADGLKRPVLLYSIPQYTGFQMDVAMIGRLSRHPNIVGMKESSGNLDFVRAILRRVKPGFRFLVGSGLLFPAVLEAGACGAVLGQATFEPAICLSLHEAFRRQDGEATEMLRARLVMLLNEITTRYGIPGVKAAMDLSGYVGGDPRPPLLPLKAADRRRIASVLKQARAGLGL